MLISLILGLPLLMVSGSELLAGLGAAVGGCHGVGLNPSGGGGLLALGGGDWHILAGQARLLLLGLHGGGLGLCGEGVLLAGGGGDSDWRAWDIRALLLGLKRVRLAGLLGHDGEGDLGWLAGRVGGGYFIHLLLSLVSLVL